MLYNGDKSRFLSICDAVLSVILLVAFAIWVINLDV